MALLTFKNFKNVNDILMTALSLLGFGVETGEIWRIFIRHLVHGHFTESGKACFLLSE